METPDLRSNAVLADLHTADLDLLSPLLRVASLRQGAVLQAENEPVDLVHFPLAGTVSMFATMRNGTCIETVMVGRNGAVGLSLCSDFATSPGRVLVSQPGSAMVIEASKLRTLMRDREGIRNSILAYQENLFADMQQTAACNALHRIEQRVARWLLQTFDLVDCAPLLLTQELLAQSTGVRRTTITLVARKLQDNGSIRYRRGRVELLNRASLAAWTCECYEAIRRRNRNRMVNSFS
jgi:CRP-like cAMP-binding protein